MNILCVCRCKTCEMDLLLIVEDVSPLIQKVSSVQKKPFKERHLELLSIIDLILYSSKAYFRLTMCMHVQTRNVNVQ